MNSVCLPRLLALYSRILLRPVFNLPIETQMADIFAMLETLGYDAAVMLREAMRVSREELNGADPPEWLAFYREHAAKASKDGA